VPRNRRDVPREERLAQLVAVARELFLSRGYAGTTLADIARSAGVAPNALRWYLPTKDAWLAAVLDAALDDVAASADPDPLVALLGAVERLRASRSLSPALYDRAEESAELAQFCRRLSTWLTDKINEVLDAHRLTGPDRDMAAAALGLLLENEFARPADATERSEVLRFIVSRVLEPPSSRARRSTKPRQRVGTTGA
jgi:TetR/AcrR family transcriptional regulator, repressor of the mexAB-oprM multidrug resistance operon